MKNKLGIIKTEKGATFVEIMLAVAILAIIAVPLLSTVIASVKNNATAKEKTEAIALAEMAMGNIKAQANLTTTSSAIYADLSSGAFEVSYDITKKSEATVSKSTQTQYIYDTSTAQQADIELAVDQTELNIGGKGTVDITVNVSHGNVVNTNTLEDIDVNNENLELNVYDDRFKLNVQQDKNKSVADTFSPINDEIIIKVKFTEEETPTQKGTYKPLKINTFDNSDSKNKLIIYVVDDHKPGVNFINKGTAINTGTAKDFNLAYITSDVFDYSSAINKLFEVTVIIKNKSQNKEIYRVSSYVKK